jgi:ring-1,2-phenylacetyl-CoA epoxidase subunit PaaD
MVTRTSQGNMTEQDIWRELECITDPEIPVLTLTEMNVIRSVSVKDQAAVVTISPTFAGCPALEHIKQEIRARLIEMGCSSVEIQTTYSPPWSSDMLGAEAREKLRSFGIAPPELSSEIPATLLISPACPQCGSMQTQIENEFGSTLCKQLFYCTACKQSFERFKTI